MANNARPIASAVILPTVDREPAALAKRRHSSPSVPDYKRARISGDENVVPNNVATSVPNNVAALVPINPAALVPDDQIPSEGNRGILGDSSVAENRKIFKKSSVAEEKKRGQRLFGGLLNALSQSAPNGQQKRRREIEKRQQERVKAQKAQDDVCRAKTFTNLRSARKLQQVKFDEESMRIRHANMLAMANFLCTKAEPKLYYKPWELLPEQEERIKTQIASVEAIISRELLEFEKRRSSKTVSEERESKTYSAPKDSVGESRTESLSVAANTTSDDTTKDNCQEPEKKQVEKTEKEGEEHHGEVVLENEEDTVIY